MLTERETSRSIAFSFWLERPGGRSGSAHWQQPRDPRASLGARNGPLWTSKQKAFACDKSTKKRMELWINYIIINELLYIMNYIMNYINDLFSMRLNRNWIELNLTDAQRSWVSGAKSSMGPHRAKAWPKSFLRRGTRLEKPKAHAKLDENRWKSAKIAVQSLLFASFLLEICRTLRFSSVFIAALSRRDEKIWKAFHMRILGFSPR